MKALFYGWYVVLACATIASLSWGLAFYGLGVYLAALHRDHGWPTGLISMAVTVYYLVGGVGIMLVGRLIDRHGPRWILTYGAVAMASALAALGFITEPWQLFADYVMLATGWACLSSTGLSATLLPWFRRRQALAMTLALTGASVGGMVLVPALVIAIQRTGFRDAMLGAAALVLVVVLGLVALVIRPAPADLGDEGAIAGESAPATDAREWTWRRALGAPLFWSITVPFGFALAAQVGFLVHQLSVLTPALGEAQAALAVSATTVAALLGRIGIGVLADRYDPWLLSAWNIGIQATALAAMVAHPSPLVLYAGSLLVGVAVGNMITLPPLLVRDEFGTRSFGTVFGAVSALTQTGLAFGPAVVGLIRDHWGSYRPALGLLVALEVAATAIVLWGRAARRREA